MAFNWFQRTPRGLRSIDELAHEKSKSIATRYDLELGMIFPLCAEVNAELSQHNRRLIIHATAEDRDVLCDTYEQKLAAAAVVAYELSIKEAVQFPNPTSAQAKSLPDGLLNAIKPANWRVTRLGSASQYELMGRIFEHNLKYLPFDLERTGVIDVDIDKTNAILNHRAYFPDEYRANEIKSTFRNLRTGQLL